MPTKDITRETTKAMRGLLCLVAIWASGFVCSGESCGSIIGHALTDTSFEQTSCGAGASDNASPDATVLFRRYLDDKRSEDFPAHWCDWPNGGESTSSSGTGLGGGGSVAISPYRAYSDSGAELIGRVLAAPLPAVSIPPCDDLLRPPQHI